MLQFHIYREIRHDNPGKPTYRQIGSTLYEDDARALLSRWHSGYIITTEGKMLLEKNLTKDQEDG
jgi:hypothetical protein